MRNILNYSKLALEVEKQKMSKLQLAEKCGISRVTLDNVLKGKEIGLYKFLNIVDALGFPIGYFFDEGNGGVRTAGRDYVEKGRIVHNGPAAAPHDAKEIEKLRKENEDLRRSLIDAQAKIIRLMEQK